MCKSKAQGGQRCYAHAEEKLANAEAKLAQQREAYQQACVDADIAPWHEPPDGPEGDEVRAAKARVQEGIAEQRVAKVEMASTPKGHKIYQQQADRLASLAAKMRSEGRTVLADRTDQVAWKTRDIVSDGQKLRDTNWLVARGYNRATLEQASQGAVEMERNRVTANERERRAERRLAVERANQTRPADPTGGAGVHVHQPTTGVRHDGFGNSREYVTVQVHSGGDYLTFSKYPGEEGWMCDSAFPKGTPGGGWSHGDGARDTLKHPASPEFAARLDKAALDAGFLVGPERISKRPQPS